MTSRLERPQRNTTHYVAFSKSQYSTSYIARGYSSALLCIGSINSGFLVSYEIKMLVIMT